MSTCNWVVEFKSSPNEDIICGEPAEMFGIVLRTTAINRCARHSVIVSQNTTKFKTEQERDLELLRRSL